MFYDLSEKKHADYIRALRIRAVAQNYKNNELSQSDVSELEEIIKFAKENEDKFVLDELSKHSCIDLILDMKGRFENTESV